MNTGRTFRAISVRTFFAAALSVIAAAVVATPADAVDMTFRSCVQSHFWGDEVRTYDGWGARMVPPLTGIGNCDDGLGFDTTQGAPKDSLGGWRFELPTHPETTSMSLAIDGGDTTTGFRYTLTTCQGCAPLPLPLREPGDPPQTLTYEGLDASIVQIMVTCTENPCAPAQTLRFHDLLLNIRDDQAPTVKELHVDPTGWHKRKDLRATIDITDGRGTGLERAGAFIEGGGMVFADSTDCSLLYGGLLKSIYVFNDFCDDDGMTYYGRVDLNGIELDGRKTLSAFAVDGAGNEMSPATAPFFVDDTAPELPEDVTVSGVDAGGWTSKDRVTLGWTNLPSDPELGEQSPHARDWIQTKQIDPPGALGDPQDRVSYQPLDNTLPWPVSWPMVFIPADGRWNFWIWTEDEAGNFSPKRKIEIRRDRTAPPAPALAANPWVNRETLIDGYAQHIGTQGLVGIEAGICGYAMSINAQPASVPEAKITHPGALTDLPVPAGVPAIDNYVHVRAISCSGLASVETATAALRVDDADPEPTINGVPPSGWTQSAVDITLGATDARSGVKSISYRVDSGAKTEVVGASAGLNVPEGFHELRVTATDNAGNTAPELVRQIRIDKTPPVAAFEPRDSTRPTRVTAKVSDLSSGVADAQMKIRRIDVADTGWHTLSTDRVADPDNPKGLLLSTEIPDADLVPGTYALQLSARDNAGNGVDTDLIGLTDLSMRMALPLRRRLQVTALIGAAKKRCGTKRANKCGRPTIDVDGARRLRIAKYGAKLALVGELRDAAGVAIAGRQVHVVETPRGGGRSLVGRPVTDAKGRYEFALKAGPSRRLEVELPATAQDLPAAGSAELKVAAAAKMTVNRRTARVGRKLKFSGKLRGLVDGFPAARVPVNLEFFSPVNSHASLTSTKTNSLGAFTASYTIANPTKKPFWLRVRASIVAGSTTWPYEDGYSNWISIRIKP